MSTVSVAHPPLNILDIPTIKDLRRGLEAAARERSTAVVVLRSGLSGAFSAGVDIRDHYPRRARALFSAFHDFIARLARLDKVTVAVADGHALGGGCEILLACDVVVASSRSRLGFPEISVGCFPPVATVLLQQVTGWQKAADLIYSGAAMSAEEAQRWGLVTLAPPPEVLEHAVGEMLKRILTHSPVVLRKTAKALKAARAGLPAALQAAEKIYLKELLKSKDAIEGLDAFLEKRPPRWRNR